MQRRHIIWGLVLGLVIVGVVALFARRPPEFTEIKLADGSVLRVEKIVFGKRGEFAMPLSWTQRLKRQLVARLPQQWTSRLSVPTSMGSWWYNTTVHTNTDAIHIWVTQRNPATGVYTRMQGTSVRLVDEHGCLFAPTQTGGGNGSFGTPGSGPPTGPPGTGGANSYDFTWHTFEAFPRNEPKLRLRFYENGDKVIGEVVIANPAPRSNAPAAWTAEALPAVHEHDGVSFSLLEVTLKTNRPGNRKPFYINSKFEVKAGGVVSKDWEAVDTELWDNWGNFASKVGGDALWLCPENSLWKFSVRFFGSEQAQTASNATWTVPGLKVPAPGESRALNVSNALQGVSVQVFALTGTGNATYSNNVVVQSSVATDVRSGGGISSSSGYSGGAGAFTRTYTLRGVTPHVALLVTGMSQDQRLSVRATDDQGRQIYGRTWGQGKVNPGDRAKIQYLEQGAGNETRFIPLDIPEDAKTVDLTFCIHGARVEEFVFRPPQK